MIFNIFIIFLNCYSIINNLNCLISFNIFKET